MGRAYDGEIVATMGLYPDSALAAYVSELGLRLARLSERPSLPWAFRVVDDPVVNAFALPGGFIYITRGILAHFGSEAQLVAVLGHEIGHVTARHSVEQLSKQQLAQFGLVAGAIVAPELAGYADLAQAALGVLFLKFGRDDERQADDLGFRYMRRAGYEPREMAEVFTMLERVSGAHPGDRTPEWLSTHPNPENRRERIEQRIAAEGAAADTMVRRDAYLRRLASLVYGQNPREGYFRGAEFVHPELRFRLTFPEAWKTINQKQAVLGASPGEDALLELTVARESTPEAAARQFFAQEGIVPRGRSAGNINGLAAVTAAFDARFERGTLSGSVAFVAHGGAIYRLLGYAAQARWPTYQAALERAIRSFAPLADPAILAVQPWRLDVVELDRAVTLDEFARSYPGPVKPEALALLNNVSPDARLEAATLVKRVVGEPWP